MPGYESTTGTGELVLPMAEDLPVFNSLDDPIPPLRPDLDIIPIEHQGQSYLYFHDMLGYASENLALHRDSASLLALLDGSRSVRDIISLIHSNGQKDSTSIHARNLLDQIQQLDRQFLLMSEHYRSYAEETESVFEKAAVRKPYLAGSSYPAEPEAISRHFEEIFSKYEDKLNTTDNGQIKAVFAPHIDPRVNQEAYVKAFAPLKGATPDRVVILATSHYSGMYPGVYDDTPFMATRKGYELPNGTFPADGPFIDYLEEHASEAGINFYDRAHRIEHSIELHLIHLRHVLGKTIPIVPILVGPFDDLLYKPDGFKGQQLKNFANLINSYLEEDELETLFLISGDLAHVGKKFGDETPAHNMFEDVKGFDEQFLEAAGQANPEKLLNAVKSNYDAFRICGFSPLLSYLTIAPGQKSELAAYELWDERERESAVTFGTLHYFS